MLLGRSIAENISCPLGFEKIAIARPLLMLLDRERPLSNGLQAAPSEEPHLAGSGPGGRQRVPQKLDFARAADESEV